MPFSITNSFNLQSKWPIKINQHSNKWRYQFFSPLHTQQPTSLSFNMNLNALDTWKFSWEVGGGKTWYTSSGTFNVGWKIFMDFWSALESCPLELSIREWISGSKVKVEKGKSETKRGRERMTLNYFEWTNNKLFINMNGHEEAPRTKKINYRREIHWWMGLTWSI